MAIVVEHGSGYVTLLELPSGNSTEGVHAETTRNIFDLPDSCGTPSLGSADQLR
jgi:hypothetical protein